MNKELTITQNTRLPLSLVVGICSALIAAIAWGVTVDMKATRAVDEQQKIVPLLLEIKQELGIIKGELQTRRKSKGE